MPVPDVPDVPIDSLRVDSHAANARGLKARGLKARGLRARERCVVNLGAPNKNAKVRRDGRQESTR